MSNDNVINMKEYTTKLKENISLLIEDATYSELCNYIRVLPEYYANEEKLYYWGVAFINEYYKKAVELENIEDISERSRLQHELYILYLCERYDHICFSFKEFITFSKLLVTAFANYNPKKPRERDKNPYRCGDKEIEDIINRVAYKVIHSPKEHAFEITSYKLDILRNILSDKIDEVYKKEIEKIDLKNGEMVGILSEERIKEVTKRKKRYG